MTETRKNLCDTCCTEYILCTHPPEDRVGPIQSCGKYIPNREEELRLRGAARSQCVIPGCGAGADRGKPCATCEAAYEWGVEVGVKAGIRAGSDAMRSEVVALIEERQVE